MRKAKPRNWMLRSYRKDGGKEKPIPKHFMDMIREMEGVRKGESEEPETKKKTKKGLLNAD